MKTLMIVPMALGLVLMMGTGEPAQAATSPQPSNPSVSDGIVKVRHGDHRRHHGRHHRRHRHGGWGGYYGPGPYYGPGYYGPSCSIITTPLGNFQVCN